MEYIYEYLVQIPVRSKEMISNIKEEIQVKNDIAVVLHQKPSIRRFTVADERLISETVKKEIEWKKTEEKFLFGGALIMKTPTFNSIQIELEKYFLQKGYSIKANQIGERRLSL